MSDHDANANSYFHFARAEAQERAECPNHGGPHGGGVGLVGAG